MHTTMIIINATTVAGICATAKNAILVFSVFMENAMAKMASNTPKMKRPLTSPQPMSSTRTHSARFVVCRLVMPLNSDIYDASNHAPIIVMAATTHTPRAAVTVTDSGAAVSIVPADMVSASTSDGNHVCLNMVAKFEQ